MKTNPFSLALFLTLLLLGALLFPPTASASTVLGSQHSGNFGYELVGFGQPSSNVAFNGNVILNTIPAGALIHFAAVYLNDFNPGGGSIDASITDPFSTNTSIAFNQFSTSQSPNPGGLAFGWEIPINPFLITGNGLYNIGVNPNGINGNASQMAGAGLLVIYSSPTILTQSTITVMHGAELLDNINNSIASASVSFPEAGNPIGAGSGQLSILTFGDDAFDMPPTTNELVQFNGSTVHTGLDGNLMPNASIVTTPVTTLAGNNANSATVTAGADIFSWHVSVLQSPIPEPSRALLAFLGIGAMMLAGRRR